MCLTSEAAISASGFSSREWKACYYGGQTAAREDVVVRVFAEGLEINRAGGRMFWRYSEVRRGSESVSGTALRLERGTKIPEVLVVSDHALVDAIRAIAPALNLGSKPPGGARFLAWLAGGVMLAAAVLFILYQYALPAVGERLATVIPVSWEEALGRAVVARFAPAGKSCDDPALGRALDEIVVRLQRGSPQSPYTYRLHVVDTGETNAFAAPGGYIVVFAGLLRKTGSAEELAAVLAHEIEHVEGRHGTRAVLRSITFWALLSLITGDADATLVQLAGLLGELRYRRDDEVEADRRALSRMQAARLDARAMFRVYRMLERESADLPKVVSYFSTHPRVAERIEDLERRAATARYHAEPLLAGQHWPPAPDCRQ